MLAIKAARKFILENPADSGSAVLSDLAVALADETPFDLARLYSLDPQLFELAVELIKEWRLDRYYMGKAKLFDLSLQVRDLGA